MKGFCTALAVAFVTILAMSACNDYGNTFQGNTGAAISSLSPADALAGGQPFTLTVNGAGFVAQTVVQWNGKNLPNSVLINSSLMTATVPAAMIANPGNVSVNTLSPHSGAGQNGLSNVVSFTIFPPANPPPTLSSLKPSCAVTGSASFTLTITGTKFIPASDPSGGSTVNWNAATQTTLPIIGTITQTQIQATVSSSLVSQMGSATVTVSNPPVPNSPQGGGGPSNGLAFTIAGSCPAAVKAASAPSASEAQIAVAEDTPAISRDGRFVAFTGMENDHAQIFLRDTCQDAEASCQQRTILLSVAADGASANDDSRFPSMSADGRFVAFSSAATNLTEAAPSGRQIYLRDTCFGAAASCTPSTRLISTDVDGALVGTESILPSVSGSGRFVAFLAATTSHAAKPSPGRFFPDGAFVQVFVRDTCFGAANCTPSTTRVSLQSSDALGRDEKPAGPALSGGKHVAIAGAASATRFTRSLSIDDSVFLALLSEKP